MIFIEEPFKFVFAPETFEDENPLTIWGYWVDPDEKNKKLRSADGLNLPPMKEYLKDYHYKNFLVNLLHLECMPQMVITQLKTNSQLN